MEDEDLDLIDFGFDEEDENGLDAELSEEEDDFDFYDENGEENSKIEQNKTAVATTINNEQSATTAPGISRMALESKAGLQNADMNHINNVIYQLSKGSKFYENEKRKEERVNRQIGEMKDRMKRLDRTDDESVREEIDKRVVELEAARVLETTWIHVDMDAFYASVEIRDNPSLKGKPVAVGGIGMISTSSYEARKMGVRSAMPGFIGKQLCPDLIFVKPNFDKYKQVSTITRQIFADYDPKYESYSLDEASLNITEYLRNHPEKNSKGVVLEIQKRVVESTQCTCSIGVAVNKRLAKICTDINKPNGHFILPAERRTILDFISKQPVKKIPGIGKVTGQLLKGIGIETVGQMYENRVLLKKVFSERSFNFFLDASLGLGSTNHAPIKPRKSIGRQRTFGALADKDKLLAKLQHICAIVEKDMIKNNKEAKKVTLVYKKSNFELKTKTATLNKYIMKQEDIFVHAKDMFLQEFPCELRLLGVRMSSWKPEVEAKPANEKQQKFFKSFFTKGETNATNGSNNAPVKNITETNVEKAVPVAPQEVIDLDASIDKELNSNVPMKDEIARSPSETNKVGEKRKLSSPSKQSPTKKKRKSNEGIPVEINQKTLDCFFKGKK
jgi:nucleotidyltransferase/DNA polymerase involved in DNA repair